MLGERERFLKKKKARLSNADLNGTKQVTRSHTANDKYTVLLPFERDSSKEVFQRLSIL